MPNYKSKMLTFLSLGEMSSMLLDNTDEDGILFAVATDATNFKIVMWRKNSTATVDNDLVYSANGPGRWHVLETGSSGGGSSSDIIQFATNTLPSSPDTGKSMCVLTKTDPYRTLTYVWNDGWQLVSFTNICEYLGCGDINSLSDGDAEGQIAINTADDAIFIWNGYLWQQIYP